MYHIKLATFFEIHGSTFSMGCKDCWKFSFRNPYLENLIFFFFLNFVKLFDGPKTIVNCFVFIIYSAQMLMKHVLDWVWETCQWTKKSEFLNWSVYWQTVTVCQLEIIGRPSKTYERALERCRNLLNSAVIVALLYRATGVCQQEDFGITFTNFVNGLPIISNWQTVTVCQ